MYEAFFKLAGFRIPTTRFLIKVLMEYKIHITQWSPFGIIRILHFEASCRALRVEPTFERFNVFYDLEVKQGGWYSFVGRKDVPTMVTAGTSPKSMRDWKECFFYVKAGVLPVNMPWFAKGINTKYPSFPVMEGYENQDWFLTLTENHSPLNYFHKCTDELLCLLGMNIAGIPEGRDVLPYG